MLDQDQSPSSCGGTRGSSSLHHKDGNSNLLLGTSPDGLLGSAGGDQNRNQMRPRSLAPLGGGPALSSHGAGVLSPRSRLPCWSPLEPLPEVECGDDVSGRVPPDGAEETRMEEEVRRGVVHHSEEKLGAKHQRQQRRSSSGFRGGEEETDEEDEEDEEDEDEWADSDSESGLSLSSLHMENGGGGPPGGRWGRIGVGEPRPSLDQEPEGAGARRRRGSPGRPREDADPSSDSDGEPPEPVWTLRDRERFKAQEMEKHQAQLTMYRRLALIRWVRTLQGRIQEQQNRLQSSFDLILTQRKELLRMGAAAAVANAAPAATAAAGQW